MTQRKWSEVIEINRAPLHIAVDDERHVVYIGYGEPPKDWYKPWTRGVVGPMAEMLYLALCGHEYNLSGLLHFSRTRAAYARDMILNNKMFWGESPAQFGGLELAKEVLYATNLDFVYPGLGQTFLDDRGRILNTKIEPVDAAELAA